MQTADAAYVRQPDGRPRASGYTGADRVGASRRHLVSAEHGAPATWSPETAFYRTAVFGGPQAYVANELGGAARGLQLYGQDAAARRSALADTSSEQSCTKYQHPNKKLCPGLMVRV
jgi:hypothetical protein